MTLVMEQYKNDIYYISMSYENGLIIVQVCPRLKDNWVGYPIRRMTYSLADEKQARATYRRYIKRYTD